MPGLTSRQKAEQARAQEEEGKRRRQAAVVARMKRRGEIKKRMLALTFEGPTPEEGAEVLNGDLRAGEVLTGRDGAAMALVRLDRLAGELSVEGRPVSANRPAYFPASA